MSLAGIMHNLCSRGLNPGHPTYLFKRWIYERWVDRVYLWCI